MNIVIAMTHIWNIKRAEKIKQDYPEHDFEIITNKNELTKNRLDELKPRYVFFYSLVMDITVRDF